MVFGACQFEKFGNILSMKFVKYGRRAGPQVQYQTIWKSIQITSKDYRCQNLKASKKALHISERQYAQVREGYRAFPPSSAFNSTVLLRPKSKSFDSILFAILPGFSFFLHRLESSYK
jgi:hypothetical protein